MIKKLTFGIIILLLVSCGVDHTDFSGDWIDKKNESDKMIISKNGDNYIVENREKKYPAQEKDGLLEISAELPIKATIDDNDILIVNGKEYIRLKKATRPKYTGSWKSKNEGPYGHCVISINSGKRIELKPIDLSCQHYAYKMQYPKYNNGQIEYTRRQYDEMGGSDRIKSTISLISDTEIEITYENNYQSPERYIRQ